MNILQIKKTALGVWIFLFLLLYFTPNINAQRNGYLIITADSLKPAFKDLAWSKALKGYDTKIASVEDIYRDYSTDYPDSVERIKRYIYKQYIDSNKKLKYILLGGDASIVPIRKCSCDIHLNDYSWIIHSDNIPADLYYVAFDDYSTHFNWNYDEDDKFAEYQKVYHLETQQWTCTDIDSTHFDLDPYYGVLLGRLPINNSAQVQNYCTKLYRYERDMFDNHDYYNRFLLAGKVVDGPYNSEISDSHHRADSLSQIISQSGYNANITMMFDTNTVNPSLSFTKENLQNTLQNVAYNFVNIDTHGDRMGFVTENGDFTSAYLNSDFKNAAIITTPACKVCRFTEGVSIGQSFILNPNTANIAFLGNTDDGLTSGDPNIPGASNKGIFYFYNHFFEASYSNSRHVGAAVLSSNRIYERQDGEGHWARLSRILFGDPEIYVNLYQPRKIQPISIVINDDNVYFDQFNDTCNYYVLLDCIYPSQTGYMGDYTNLYAKEISLGNDNGFDIYGNFVLGVYKDGYVPYRSDMDGFLNVEIQKQDISGFNLKADTFTIGSNINNDFNIGSVSLLENTNAKITFETSLTIINGFECPLGASFEAIPSNLP